MDKLIELVENQLNTKEKLIKEIEAGSFSSLSIVFLSGIEEFLALYNFFIQNKLSLSKIQYFKAAKCRQYIYKHYSKVLDDTFNSINYSILSDHNELIKEFSNYKLLNNNSHINSVYVQGAQGMIKKDKNLTIRAGEKMIELAKQRKFKPYRGFGIVFQAYGKNDQMLLDNGIKELLNSHPERDITPFSKLYFSFDTIAVAKLALRNGMEINVKHDLLPRELLEIKELDEYPYYDFLDIPPDQLGKQSGWQKLKEKFFNQLN